MNAALLTNSGPDSNDALLSLHAFTPNLSREAPAAAASFTLFARDPESFLPSGTSPFRAVLPLPGLAGIRKILCNPNFDFVLLDYDATAGNHRDRAVFLRFASELLRLSCDLPIVVLVSQSNAFPDSVQLSLAAARNRNLFHRIIDRATHCLAFSEAIASRVRERTGRDVAVIPAGSPIPAPSCTRVEARVHLGFAEPGQDLLIGLLSRQSDLNLDWLTAGCSEALRVASSVRILYIGPDGMAIRQHRFSIPLLDAGTPSPEDISIRLRAMDFALFPSTARADARPDRLPLLSCLQHGVPVIATHFSSPIDALFDPLPEGLAPVSGGNSNLGSFLEAVESLCKQITRNPAPREADPLLAECYQSRFSAQAALEKVFSVFSQTCNQPS